MKPTSNAQTEERRATVADAPPVLLVPAWRFFVRRLPLVPGQDAAAQAGLALEAIGPFAPAQLYHGHYASPDGTEALVFATYRRNISPAELAAWAEAEEVLPSFAFWLGQPAPAAPEVWVHTSLAGLTVLGWDGRSPLPAVVLARDTAGPAPDGLKDELLQEARRRLDAGAATVREFAGEIAPGARSKQGLTLSLGERTSRFTPAQLRSLDVRDKSELTARQASRRRDHGLWLAFAATAAALAACLAVEAGLAVSRGMLARERARQEASAGEVRRIEQAHQVVARLEQLAGQSLKPFEMLAAVNAVRPPTVEFVRASTPGPLQMEIEAQSGNAADPQAYERALRGLATIERIELRDLRSSGGRTTFLVLVGFKPGFAGPGGSP
jgi:hypothetical protein